MQDGGRKKRRVEVMCVWGGGLRPTTFLSFRMTVCAWLSVYCLLCLYFLFSIFFFFFLRSSRHGNEDLGSWWPFFFQVLLGYPTTHHQRHIKQDLTHDMLMQRGGKRPGQSDESRTQELGLLSRPRRQHIWRHRRDWSKHQRACCHVTHCFGFKVNADGNMNTKQKNWIKSFFSR